MVYNTYTHVPCNLILSHRLCLVTSLPSNHRGDSNEIDAIDITHFSGIDDVHRMRAFAMISWNRENETDSRTRALDCRIVVENEYWIWSDMHGASVLLIELLYACSIEWHRMPAISISLCVVQKCGCGLPGFFPRNLYNAMSRSTILYCYIGNELCYMSEVTAIEANEWKRKTLSMDHFHLTLMPFSLSAMLQF